jgi:xylulose-5-phosphate/fructose-6-phosphate phosphoketolase
MMDQYSKFLKMAFEVSWRSALPSLNYIESSTLWRQEHNGFSHQNPGFINTLLNKKSNMIRIYFPPDANSLIATMEHVLHSRNYINLVVASKQETAQWLTMEEAVAHCRSGASVWHWCSTDEGKDPDVVLCGIGCETMYEVVAAAAMLRKDFPALRIRVVNVTDLLILDSDRQHQHRLSSQVFNSLFTHHKPVIINFHGYPSAVKQLLFGRGASTNQKIAMPTMGHGPATGAPIIESGRFFINGYIEEGTTTTPFKMLVANRCSRFHLAMQAIMLSSSNENVAPWAIEKMSHFEYILKKHEQHITDHGADPEGLYDKEQFEIFGRTLKCEHPHCPDTHFSAVH